MGIRLGNQEGSFTWLAYLPWVPHDGPIRDWRYLTLNGDIEPHHDARHVLRPPLACVIVAGVGGKEEEYSRLLGDRA